MKSNMGAADRIIRLIIAAIISILYISEIISGTLGIVLLALAIIFVATSLINFCPLYYPFRFSTRKKQK